MTLAEVVASGSDLFGACTSCGRERRIAPATIRVDGSFTLDRIQSLMRCRDCEEKAIVLSVAPRRGTLEEVKAHPVVQAVVQAFPGATVTVEDDDGH